jgi:hypothetical protein
LKVHYSVDLWATVKDCYDVFAVTARLEISPSSSALRELISKLPDTIRFSETFHASASELMAAVRSHGLEGVARRHDSDSESRESSERCSFVKSERSQRDKWLLSAWTWTSLLT